MDMRDKPDPTKEYTINWEAKCDLCGHIFVPILILGKDPNKADCPNCENFAYFDRDFKK